MFSRPGEASIFPRFAIPDGESPFLQPETVWDFRLPRVASINRSQATSRDVALYLSGEIGATEAFTLWSDGSDIPVFAWQLADGHTGNWNLQTKAFHH